MNPILKDLRFIVAGTLLVFGLAYYFLRLPAPEDIESTHVDQKSATSSKALDPEVFSPTVTSTVTAPSLQSPPVSLPSVVLPPGSQVIPLATLKTSAMVKTDEVPALTFKANSIGSFPRVTVPAKSTIPIHLAVSPYEVIEEQVLDGGKLDNGDIAQTQVADSEGGIDFQFQVKKSPGSYRVAISRQGERQIFNFWVGPDLPPRVAQ